MGEPICRTGSGCLPTQFKASFDKVNYERVRGTNNHNEGNFAAICGEDTFFNDTFSVEGYRVSGGYVLNIGFQSELTGTALFGDGEIKLSYNDSVNEWKFEGATGNGKEWKFCSPNAVIDIIVKSLQCYGASVESSTVGGDKFWSLANSIDGSRASLIKSVEIYKGFGCNLETPEFGDNPTMLPF